MNDQKLSNEAKNLGSESSESPRPASGELSAAPDGTAEVPDSSVHDCGEDTCVCAG